MRGPPVSSNQNRRVHGVPRARSPGNASAADESEASATWQTLAALREARANVCRSESRCTRSHVLTGRQTGPWTCSVLVRSGVAAGIVLSVWASRFLERLVFGVAPSDVATLTAARLTLLAVGGLAAWSPARGATRTDAATVLREG